LALAAVYFSADDAERGFASLRQAFEMSGREVIFLKGAQMLRGDRDDPRCLSLVKQVGL